MEIKKRIAVVPGSFDPITNGHINLIKRSLSLFDEVIVLVAINPNKKYIFNLDERYQLAKESLKGIKRVSVAYTSGLTMDFAKKHHASALIRGVRCSDDYKYEKQLEAINKKINSNIHTIYLSARKDLKHISSSEVIMKLKKGEDVSPYVPKVVFNKLKTITF